MLTVQVSRNGSPFSDVDTVDDLDAAFDIADELGQWSIRVGPQGNERWTCPDGLAIQFIDTDTHQVSWTASDLAAYDPGG